MRPRRSHAVAVLLAVLTVVPAARASTPTGVPTREPVAGPALSGGDAVWAAPGPGFGFEILRGRPGGAAARLTAVDAPPNGTLTPALATSDRRLVVSYAVGGPTTRWNTRTVLSAPVGGAFEKLDEGCGLSGVAEIPRVVDVSGDVVAFPRCDASGRHPVVVRDYSGPTPVEHPVTGARISGLRVAGRYVAWLDGPRGIVNNAADIVVHDRLMDAEAYRLTRVAIGGDVHSLDLQEDGKVTYSFVGGGGRRIGWASPAEPRPHPLGLPARDSYEVRIAGDRIGYMTGTEPSGGVLTLAEVGVTDLAGNARKIGDLGEGSLYTDDLDFDGERVAWWSYRCTDAVVRVASADGPDTSTGPRSGCALRFERAARLKSAWVRLYPDCYGFEAKDCEARKVVLTSGGGRSRVVVGRGASARRVDLTRSGLALLRSRSRLRVRASALLTDAAGRRERRVGKLTLARR